MNLFSFPFYSSKADRLSFVQRFAAILLSMANGKNAKEGFAAFPPFNPETGALVQYTEEEMNAAPVTEGPGSYGYEDLPQTDPNAHPVNP